MKKITLALLIVGSAVSAANAAPSYLKPDGKGGYDVTYDYKDKEKSNWYTAVRADMNLLSWKNVYTSEDVDHNGTDKYSMEPAFGGNVSVGRRFDYFWRWDIEAGYISEFTDSDATTSFKLSVPYVIGNLMYDFTSGLYLGAGFGFAKPTTTLDGDLWVNNSNDREESSVSPMGAIMLGFSHKLDDNMVVDLRYRMAGFSGTEHERSYELNNAGTITRVDFTNEIGLILDNSVSIGLRYEF